MSHREPQRDAVPPITCCHLTRYPPAAEGRTRSLKPSKLQASRSAVKSDRAIMSETAVRDVTIPLAHGANCRLPSSEEMAREMMAWPRDLPRRCLLRLLSTSQSGSFEHCHSGSNFVTCLSGSRKRRKCLLHCSQKATAIPPID